MDNLKKSTIIEGVFSAESPDTSGEILSVRGADIEELKTGRSVANVEHTNPEDIKENKPENKGFEGFQSIVGRVITAKKIFSEKDCSNEKELEVYKKLQVPLIWGSVELFDDQDHPNAKATAAIIKAYANAGVDQQIGFSVEGATVKRNGKVLEETAIRRVAITHKPCNKAAKVEFIQDSPQSVRKSISTEAENAGYEPLYKSAFNAVYIQQQKVNDYGLSAALENLKKTISAGGMGAAPSALSGGSALQKESQDSELHKLVKLYRKKKYNKSFLKSQIPNISDDQAEKVHKAINKIIKAENELEAVKIYQTLSEKKKQQ
jgi:hypothetical protein